MPKITKRATMLHLQNQIDLIDKLVAKYIAEREELIAKLEEVKKRPE